MSALATKTVLTSLETFKNGKNLVNILIWFI